MGKHKKHKAKHPKLPSRAVKLAMDCVWNVEGRTLKNKDEPYFGIGKVKEKISEL
jgi:hypothetical protein